MCGHRRVNGFQNTFLASAPDEVKAARKQLGMIFWISDRAEAEEPSDIDDTGLPHRQDAVLLWTFRRPEAQTS